MAGVVRTLDDGFATTIGFAAARAEFEEITVQPPGWSSGEPIDTTTMKNTKYRTKAPRSLIEAVDGDVTVAYDPTAMDPTVFDAIRLNQEITITYPDGGTLVFYGYAKTFQPDALEEGKRPTAKLGIVATLTDDSDGTEKAPVFTAGTGTGG